MSHMEDMLDLYHCPYDPEVPVVCIDEQPVQLVEEMRVPLPAKPGQPSAIVYEYEVMVRPISSCLQTP